MISGSQLLEHMNGVEIRCRLRTKNKNKHPTHKTLTLRMCPIHQIIKCLSVWREKKLRGERRGGTDLRQGKVTKATFRGKLKEGKEHIL